MTWDLIYKIMTSNYDEFAMNLTRGQAPCESNQVRLSRPVLTAAVSTLY